MSSRKKIQIFYGGFKAIKGGVNSNTITLTKELEKNFDVSLYTLDNLPFLIKFFPHTIEKIVNFFFLPLGFFYKDICTRFLFKLFFDKKVDYRIFQDVYLSWNSNIPSITILHAVWSDNLQKFAIKKKKLEKLKQKEINKINSIKHPVCTVSTEYKNYILKKHFFNNIKNEMNVVELGIKKNSVIIRNKQKQKKLIYIGSLEKRKNIFFLLRVFHKIYKYNQKYRLTIIGKGPDEYQLKGIVKKLKLPVKFLGNKNHKEIFNELSKHNIYTHTSIKESFSLSLLEAKIAGLSTVAYKYLQVPKNFIDYGVNEFSENKWFNTIINIKKKPIKFKYKKYLINNMVNRLLKIAK